MNTAEYELMNLQLLDCDPLQSETPIETDLLHLRENQRRLQDIRETIQQQLDRAPNLTQKRGQLSLQKNAEQLEKLDSQIREGEAHLRRIRDNQRRHAANAATLNEAIAKYNLHSSTPLPLQPQAGESSLQFLGRIQLYLHEKRRTAPPPPPNFLQYMGAFTNNVLARQVNQILSNREKAQLVKNWDAFTQSFNEIYGGSEMAVVNIDPLECVEFIQGFLDILPDQN